MRRSNAVALRPQRAHEAERHAECAHCMQLIRTGPTGSGAENAGVRKTSSHGILYGALAKTASVISFINQRATTMCFARRTYPNNPAYLIPAPVSGTRWRQRSPP